ncbi:MAG TPA: type I methionyl aminopeptidase [Acidobacteriaceae bacterium]|jgi:methionyl aminopeptidase|nr:type I methionyl aminopeptidase [Acidobacteriaceae bacterium]
MAIVIKTVKEVEKMRRAGGIVREVLHAVRAMVKPGVTTLELEKVAETMIEKAGAKPAFKGYHGFPCVLCTSLNEQVVHGIPSGKTVLREGDILSVDCGAVIDGYYGDSAITIPVGKVAAGTQRLLDITQGSLERAIGTVRPGATLGDVGAAVQEMVEAEGFSVVKEFVGHGIGTHMHEDPQIPNFGQRGRGVRLREGMVLAIEPMVNAGGDAVRVLKDGWTAVTEDGSLSAHFEHTVAVTKDGAAILTL